MNESALIRAANQGALVLGWYLLGFGLALQYVNTPTNTKLIVSGFGTIEFVYRYGALCAELEREREKDVLLLTVPFLAAMLFSFHKSEPIPSIGSPKALPLEVE